MIGGAALILMGVIDRATQDVDCLEPDLPEPVRQAAEAFASSYRGAGSPLRKDWLNEGPKALRNDLPAGWQDRVVLLLERPGLSLHTLGRLELLATKLFAYCDRQQDEGDCLALKPTFDELNRCLGWLSERDGHPQWPKHVRLSLHALAERLGYAYDA